MVMALDMRLKRSWVQTPAIFLSGNIGTGHRAETPCILEGKRHHTVHVSQISVVYPPTGSQPKEDEHPAYGV